MPSTSLFGIVFTEFLVSSLVNEFGITDIIDNLDFIVYHYFLKIPTIKLYSEKYA